MHVVLDGNTVIYLIEQACFATHRFGRTERLLPDYAQRRDNAWPGFVGTTNRVSRQPAGMGAPRP